MSWLQKRYSELHERGIIMYDIRPCMFYRRVLESLLEESDMSFSVFFSRYVLDPTYRMLRENFEVDSDLSRYARDYMDSLADVQDRREYNALEKELLIFRDCCEADSEYMSYETINYGTMTRRRKNKVTESPIRVLMHVRDKLDLRVGAARKQMKFADYIGWRISQGMLEMFLDVSLNDDERCLLDGHVCDDVDYQLRSEAFSMLTRRLVAEYHYLVQSLYNGDTPTLKPDFMPRLMSDRGLVY